MAEKKVQTKQETRRKTGFLFWQLIKNLAPPLEAGFGHEEARRERRG